MFDSIRCVIFDWAGTLSVPLPAMAPLVPWQHYTAAMTGLEDPRAAAKQLEEAELRAHKSCTTDCKSHVIFDIIREAGLAYEEQAIDAYRACWLPYTRAAPDAKRLLQLLRDANIPTGLLSNTIWPSQWHRDGLAREGLLDLLDVTVFSTDIDVIKPHPRAFERTLDLLGSPSASESLFVGDRLYEDISGAQKVGMRTVLVSNGSVPPIYRVQTAVEPDVEISELFQLSSLLGL